MVEVAGLFAAGPGGATASVPTPSSARLGSPPPGPGRRWGFLSASARYERELSFRGQRARGASVLGMRPVELRRSAGLWGARPCLTPRPSQFHGAGERLWERAAEVSGLPAGVSTLQAPHSGARSAHRSAVASGPTRLGRGGPALLLSRDAPWGLQPLETHRRLAPLSVLLPRVSGPSPLSLNLHPVVPGAVTQAPNCSPSP